MSEIMLETLRTFRPPFERQEWNSGVSYLRVKRSLKGNKNKHNFSLNFQAWHLWWFTTFYLTRLPTQCGQAWPVSHCRKVDNSYQCRGATQGCLRGWAKNLARELQLKKSFGSGPVQNWRATLRYRKLVKQSVRVPHDNKARFKSFINVQLRVYVCVTDLNLAASIEQEVANLVF